MAERNQEVGQEIDAGLEQRLAEVEKQIRHLDWLEQLQPEFYGDNRLSRDKKRRERLRGERLQLLTEIEQRKKNKQRERENEQRERENEQRERERERENEQREREQRERWEEWRQQQLGSSGHSSSQDERKVTDRNLLVISSRVDPGTYENLCEALGVPYNEARAILTKHLNDYQKAFLEVLHKWKGRSGGYLRDLRAVYSRANLAFPLDS